MNVDTDVVSPIIDLGLGWLVGSEEDEAEETSSICCRSETSNLADSLSRSRLVSDIKVDDEIDDGASRTIAIWTSVA